MRMEIKARNIDVPEALRRHVQRRLNFAFSRFGAEVTSAVVRLDDVNGPRGGVDQRCRLSLRGPRVGSITIEEVSVDVSAAVDIAAHRGARVVSRALSRLRDHAARSSEEQLTARH